MEVSLLSTDGLPEDCIVSVRAGSARRQAPANSGRVLRFPQLGMKENPVKVDILKQVATAHMVVMPGETRYKVAFPTSMSCEVQVRPADHAEVRFDATDTADADVAENRGKTGAGSAKDAKDYLERTQILQFVQALLQVVIKERPPDPYKYMARHFMSGYGPSDTSVADGSMVEGGDAPVERAAPPPSALEKLTEKPAAQEGAKAALSTPQAGSGRATDKPAGKPDEAQREEAAPQEDAARQQKAAQRQEAALLEATRREVARWGQRDGESKSKESENVQQNHLRWQQMGGSELEEPLQKGWVKLVRASWLVDLWHCGGVLCRRQDIPEEAFVSLEELKAAGPAHAFDPNYDHGAWLRVIVLSYPWLQPGHPDPHGENLKVIAGALKHYINPCRDCDGDVAQLYGVLIDFTALFQAERTEKENALFKLALPALNLFYSHPCTVVLKVTRFPAGYPDHSAHLYILPDGANTVEYGGRGWCFAESAMSDLVKPSSQVIDLGLPAGDSKVLSYSRLGRLIQRGRRGRAPPMHPDDFKVALNSKTFTSRQADFDRVAKLYADAFQRRLGNAVELDYSKLGWGVAEVRKLAQALRGSTPLQRLDVSRNNARGGGVEALGHALQGTISLQELNLCSNRIDAAGAAALGQVLRHRSLRTLTLSRNEIRAGSVALWEALQHNTSLRALDLSQNRIGDEGAVALGEALQHNTSLQALDLSSNGIREEGAAAVGEALQRNTSLQTLNLNSNRFGGVGAAALGKALQRNGSLQTLHLSRTVIGHAGAEALGEALQRNSSLQTLHLRSNWIGDEGAVVLGEALQHNTSLQTLDLNWNKISNAVVLGEAIQRNTSLRALDLSQNELCTEGVVALGRALLHNTSLQRLDLGRTTIRFGMNKTSGDVGAVALGEALQHNSSLQKLDLSDNAIGDVGAAALGEGLGHNTSLQTLELMCNCISGAGAVALVEGLRDNSSLQFLGLVSNDTGRDGRAALEEAARHGGFELQVLADAQL